MCAGSTPCVSTPRDAPLTASVVPFVRLLHRSLVPSLEIASRYDVCVLDVCDVLARRKWADVSDHLPSRDRAERDRDLAGRRRASSLAGRIEYTVCSSSALNRRRLDAAMADLLLDLVERYPQPGGRA